MKKRKRFDIDFDNLSANDVYYLMRVNDLGIIPYCKSASEFRNSLLSLTPEQRRVVKRRFRKLWKKSASKLNYASNETIEKRYNSRTVDGNLYRDAKRNRQEIVHSFALKTSRKK